MIEAARVGEHIKCKAGGFANFVPVRSLGVMRIRDVIYLKLLIEF